MGGDEAVALFDAEKALREAASALQAGAPRSFVYARLRIALDRLALVEPGLRGPARDLVRYAATAVKLIHDYLSKYPASGLGTVVSYVAAVAKTYHEISGGRCAYLIGSSPAALLNDVAACVHRLAEILARGKRIGLCTVVEGASGRTVEACLDWSRTEDALRRAGLVADSDYVELAGYAVDDRLYLRVGSAAGHAAEIDLRNGLVRYYDEDDTVLEEEKRLLESLGLACSIQGDMLECRGPVAEKAAVIARALALSTSMDFRHGDPVYYLARALEKDPGLALCIIRGAAEVYRD